MKLNVSFADLQTMVRRMGAPEVRWRVRDGRLADPEFLERLYKGLVVEPKDVDVDDDGLFSVRGERVLLYIKETNQDRHTLLYDTENAKRFHVADCSTLEAMRRQGHFNMRYVVTTKTTGMFPVFATNHMTGAIDEIEAPLKVCRSCLLKIRYKGYGGLNHAKKRDVWLAFDVGAFLWDNPTKFRSRPLHTDRTAPMPGSAPDWLDVVDRYRRFRQWACDDCGVSLKGHHQLLHVRPLDGNRRNTSLHNLSGTCAVCAPSPLPDRVFSAAERALAEKLRTDQKIR